MLELNSEQRKAVANGLVAVSFAAVFAFVLLIVWLGCRVLTVAAPAIIPVVLGLFFSVLFRPYFQWWKRLVRNPTIAVMLMLCSVLVPVGAAIWYYGAIIVSQLSSLITRAPEAAAQAMCWVNATFPGLVALFDKLGVSVVNWVELYKIKAVQMGVDCLGAVSGVLGVVLTIIFFIYFVTKPIVRGENVVRELAFLKIETRNFIAEQIDAFVSIVIGFFQRQVVICLIEGVYYGVGFALIGLDFGFAIGFALGVMNLVPLLGSLICLPVALPLAFFGDDGSLMRLGFVGGVWLLGQILDGYVFTPKIQGKDTGLGYAGVIFSFVFWGAVFRSPLGLLLAIPLSAFCVVFWRALKSRYIRPVV